ncbi:MAG TPA: hypothetical protein VEE86_03100 [Thermoplasmata archaeon]|nr:hypothetical protein [Thermoplasmata archaeon]
MLRCPFCGAAETDRFDLEGQRFLVFACMFTPAVDPRLSERELEEHLAKDYRPDGSSAYFQRMCDRLHLYVTKGAGSRALRDEGTDHRPA